MSGIDITIELPESHAPGELMKAYYTLMRAFGWDLYVTAHFALKGEYGPNWFAARISELTQSDRKRWPPSHKFDPQDPSVILRDYAFEYDSPYSRVFGAEWNKQTAAKKILSTRNLWFHFGDDPTAGDLREAASTVRAFVVSSGLNIAGRIEKLILRLDALASGRYSQEDRATAVKDPATPGLDTPSDLARPHIGGTWVGDIPAERYRIAPTGEILHPVSMKSLREQVVGDYREKVRAWTAVPPRGGELWVDVDGAVGGYIGASPRLLGYLGAEPEGEVARGFFTPHYYVVDGEEIVDVDSGERRSAPFAREAPNGAMLRVTTYGDVLLVDDAAGPERVSVVTPDQWFPGHLA